MTSLDGVSVKTRTSPFSIFLDSVRFSEKENRRFQYRPVIYFWNSPSPSPSQKLNSSQWCFDEMTSYRKSRQLLKMVTHYDNTSTPSIPIGSQNKLCCTFILSNIGSIIVVDNIITSQLPFIWYGRNSYFNGTLTSRWAQEKDQCGESRIFKK